MKSPGSGPPSLDDLKLFGAVAAARSYSAAARELGVPLATLSRRIAALERRLGATLLTRSTRRVEPTDAGLLLAQRAEPALRELESAIDCLGEESARARGRLRITMPADLARECLAAPLAEFAARHPDVRLELDLSSRIVDLIAERVDLAIRAGSPPDSRLIARPLAQLAQALYASPGYLASLPALTRPGDLTRVNALVLAGRSIDREWPLTRGRRRVSVRPAGNVQVNDMGALIELTAGAAGIALLPSAFVRVLLEARRLTRVLPDWSGPVVPIHAIYPDRRIPARLRLLLEHLRQWLARNPLG
jgi:DNA-binding transcriptional LysR family regulator